MSRPKTGTIISNDVKDLFLYDPDILFLPKEYVGYVLKHNDDMIYASKQADSSLSDQIGSFLVTLTSRIGIL